MSLGDSIKNLREKLSSFGKKGGGSSEGRGSKSKFDPAAALGWVKANPVIVASIAAMLIIPVVSWWFASSMHASNDEAATTRAKEMAALEKIEKSSVEYTLPGKETQKQTGIVNERTVDDYKALASRLAGDAKSIQSAALAHNQGDRKSLIKSVRVTRENVNLIAEEIFDSVRAQAAKDLTAMRAGVPPTDASLVDQLQRHQDQFIAGERKADRKSLSEEQLLRLQKALLDKRLQLYADAAANTSFYAEIDTLSLPASPLEAGTPPSEVKMFLWQWRLWIIEDVLRAVARANKPYRSVVDSPVKRIVSLTVTEDAIPKPAAPAAEAPAEGAPVDAAAPAVAAALPPIDPKAAVTYDFGKSMTGRISNSIYDVRKLQVSLVVASSMLPEVMNAITQQNLMTVVKLTVRPADAFAAADEGFIYGAMPVSLVTMTIESVWLRPWIARLMPPELQAIKGTDGRTTDDAPSETPTPVPTS